MVESIEFKTIQVTKEVWDKLGKLKEWPNKMNFNEVIEFLIKERNLWKEFYIKEIQSHGFTKEQAQEHCENTKKMYDAGELV